MRATAIFCVLVLALVVAGCNTGVQPKIDDPTRTAPVVQPQATPETASPTGLTGIVIPANQAESTSQPILGSPNCASAEANKLGAAIAKDYAFTSTEQVMAWFCDGAEFEDILVALETADQTGTSAEEMLTMLAAGMTWEEIWRVVGLTD